MPSEARAVPSDAHSATCSPRLHVLHFVFWKRHELSSHCPSRHRFTAAICIGERSSSALVRRSTSPGASPPTTKPCCSRASVAWLD
eukprot:301728-Prymnesium_polylepis.1